MTPHLSAILCEIAAERDVVPALAGTTEDARSILITNFYETIHCPATAAKREALVRVAAAATRWIEAIDLEAGVTPLPLPRPPTAQEWADLRLELELVKRQRDDLLGQSLAAAATPAHELPRIEPQLRGRSLVILPERPSRCDALSDLDDEDPQVYRCSLEPGHEGVHRNGPLLWRDPQ